MSLEEFINKYKPYQVAVMYNDFKSNYQNIEDYFKMECIDEHDVVDKEECEKTGDLYELYIYPEHPGTCFIIKASRLDIALEIISKKFNEERNDKIWQGQRK